MHWQSLFLDMITSDIAEEAAILVSTDLTKVLTNDGWEHFWYGHHDLASAAKQRFDPACVSNLPS